MVRLLKTIGVKSIDSRDRTFLMSFHPDLHALKRSIQRVGLLHPILVRENVSGAPYQVISGFRRLAVCKQLGFGEIEAFSHARSELGDLEAFEIALNENLSTRGLNLIEKSMVLHKLLYRFGLPKESVVRDYMPILGLQPNLRMLDKISQLIQLRAGIRRYIVKEEVSLANAAQVLEFPREDQEAIGRLFSELKLGENTLKEVLTLFREISLRDGLTTGELIQREIGEIASDKGSSKVHRTLRVRERLREMRYPRLTEMEKAFREKRRRLGLSPKVSLQPPPYFEGDALRIEFRFRDLDELRDILSRLNAALEMKELGEMLELAL
jgi:ParB family chromosome partitioning protein